jgi:hypothetical protein
MSDIFFKEFYNNVKDPSWPSDVENYCDFIKLPEAIKQECFDVHGLESRLQQIESADYWTSIISSDTVYQYDRLVFLPVPKCGYVYYRTLFSKLGWKKITFDQVDFDQHIVFSSIMHPLSRYLKGLTEWVWINNLFPKSRTPDDQKYFFKLMSNVLLTDNHTLPYTVVYKNVIDKINWIPSDNLTDNETKQVMMNLFKKYHYDISLPMDDPRSHESGPDKLKIYQIIEQIYKSKKIEELNILHIYMMFANDLKFYRQLVDNFDPTWTARRT